MSSSKQCLGVVCINGISARAEGRKLAEQYGCQFIETSAKQRINVDEAFAMVVREIKRSEKVRSSGGIVGELSYLLYHRSISMAVRGSS